MSNGLTENEMRRALGLDVTDPSSLSTHAAALVPVTKGKPELRATGIKPKPRSPRLRVTLLVSKEFEGESVEFIHDADTLSRFDAEQEAKNLAKKEMYRFFEVVSIMSIG
ncbi:hypothetical protein K5D43_21410 [Pseudomonas cichorii]|nr:hypothetical protein [Pseudomonas cichorii]MBX8557038.1 hypothetical protein [Pseudomonas cichorii]